MTTQVEPTRVVLLETTVQVDRHKSRHRKEAIEDKIAGFDFRVSTSISLLELKFTLLGQCILIHNELTRADARFTSVRDRLVESTHPQHKLRAHIFNNLLQVYGSSFDVTPKKDRELAEKARLTLEMMIPELYRAFHEAPTDTVLKDRINCTRAFEAPFKKGKSFDASTPICSRARGNKSCRVESAVRDSADLIETLLRMNPEPESQLGKTLTKFQDLLNSTSDPDWNWQNHCRSCGDALIAIEAKDQCTHVLTSNARDWRPLTDWMEATLELIEYPK